MNDRTLRDRTHRDGGRPCAPMDREGRFRGDLFYDSLRDMMDQEGLAERWRGIALELGYRTSPTPTLETTKYRQGRCYKATMTGGVWYLEDFSTLCLDSPNKRSFLRLLNQLSTYSGTQICAVPEDMLTLLVVISRIECFPPKEVAELGFCEDITSALTDVMPGQEMWAAGAGLAEHSSERRAHDRHSQRDE